MQAAYINPFISSLKNTFQTMLACKARRGALSLKEDCKAKHQVSGVIGLSGKAVGTVVFAIALTAHLVRVARGEEPGVGTGGVIE